MIKTRQLLVHHGVMGDGVIELFQLRGAWQFAVEKQITDFYEIGFFRELFDRITAIVKVADFTIDKRNVGATRRRRRGSA